MKTLKKNIYGLAVAAIVVTGLGACSNALDAPSMGGGNNTVNLTTPVTAPDVVAWTGNQVLGNTFNGTNYSVGTTTRTIGEPSFERWQSDRSWSKPNDIFNAEHDYVIQYLQENPNGGYKTLDIYEYVIQVVGGGNHSYQGDNADHNGSWHTVDNATSQMNQCHIDGFFTQYNNTGMNSEDCILIKNVQATNASYHDSYGSTTQNHYAFYFITFPNEEEYGYMAGKTGLYLCYDYATYKDSEKWGVSPDGIYDDWVIKLSPANGGFFEEPSQGDDNNGDNNGDDNGGDDNNGDDNDGDGDDNTGNTPDNNPGSGDNTGDNGNTGNNPGNGGITSPAGMNEVEINLALLDVHTLPDGSNKYDVEDLVSKLSIHVRYPHDVQVVLPVPEKFYCDQDDLYILKDHYTTNGEPNWVYGGETHSVSYNINGNIVKLNVTYVSALNDTQITKAGEGYIMVTTEGINQAVIDYCRTNFGDGINFEVYNYYNRGNKYTTGSYQEITYDELQWKYLNRSYVNFDYNHTGIIPDFYINAFNSLNGAYNRGDCYVWIIGDEHANNNTGTVFLNDSFYTNIYSTYNQRSGFWNAYQGTHYNASPYNWIYTSKGVIGSAEPSKNTMPDNGSWPFSTPYLMER